MYDGEQGDTLVEWLNALPAVQKIVAEQYGGVPVSKSNLSEWRLGAYEEWVREEETREMVSDLAAEAGDLGEAGEGNEIADLLASRLAAELMRSARELLQASSDPKERWQQLKEVLAQLAELRRHDHRCWRLQMDQERWEREKERMNRAKMEKELEEHKEHVLQPLWNRLSRQSLAEVFGGGELGGEIADFIHETQNLHLSDFEYRGPLARKAAEATVAGNGQSHPVAPGRTESDQKEVEKTGPPRISEPEDGLKHPKPRPAQQPSCNGA
jgi:hypothetical protein